jgi:hypothetical protein
LLTRLALATMLPDMRVSTVANNVQGSSAAYVNTGYGTPSDGSPASRPNTSEKTTMAVSG